MIKHNSLGAEAVKLTTSKIIANMLMMVSAMLLARIRTLEENGTYSQLMLVINLTTSIFMLGLPSSINYFLAKAETKENQNYFLSVYYTLSTLLSLVLGVTLVLLIPGWESYFSNFAIGKYFFFLLLFPWAKVVASSMENVLIVLKKATMLMVCRILNCVLLLAIILLVWLIDGSFKMYMILYTFVEGAFAIAVYVLAAHYTGRLHVCLDKHAIKKIFAFSVPIGLASVVGTLNIELDKLMIGRMMSTEELAVYTNASKEMPVTLIATSLTAVLMPRMVKAFDNKDNESAIDLWRDTTALSYALIVFLGIGMATFAKEAMIILYSQKYASGSAVFAIYSIGLLLKCTYFGMVLNTTGNTKKVLYCSIGSLMLNAILNFALFHRLGVIGPALATVLSCLAMQMLQLVFSSRITGVSFIKIFPWKDIVILTIINCLFAVLFGMIHTYLLPGIWTAVVLAAVWGCAYLFVIRTKIALWWQRINRF